MSTASIVQDFYRQYVSDVTLLLPLLAVEMRWELNGQVQTRSAEAFVQRQQADLASGSAETVVETLLSDSNEAIALGWANFSRTRAATRCVSVSPRHSASPRKV